MKKLLFSLALLGCLALNKANAATFKVKNTSDRVIKVQPLYENSSEETVTLQPNELSETFNSGLSPITGFRWWEQAAACTSTKKEGACFTEYEFSVRISRLSLGGKINLSGDGSYSYHFATLGGSGSGKASAQAKR